MAKMWAGRTSGQTDKLADDFNSSIHFDCRMYKHDIKGSMAHAAMLAKQGIISSDEADTLIAISFPRYSRRTVDAMKFARGRNATTVALTDSISSSVAENATHILLAKNDMASVVDSLVAPMSLLNVLIAALCQRKKEELEKTYGELEEIWDEYNTFDKRN